MADKANSALTAGSSFSVADLIYAVIGGNSRKLTAGQVGAAFGTSFPGSPTAGDRFYRTDRNIDYFYDGTRWLSDEIFTAHLANDAATATLSATNTSVQRTLNPWAGLYDIYGLEAVFAASLSTTGGWTLNLTKLIGATATDIATQAITYPGSSDWTNYRAAINAVIASTTTLFLAGGAETSGAATLSIRAALTYRLVG